MARLLALCAATALLSGCAAMAEIQQAQADADSHQCLSYGFQYGSDGYAQCRMQIVQQREAYRQQSALAYQQQMQQNYHAQMQAIQRPLPQMQGTTLPLSPMPKQTTCRTVGQYDGSLVTRCD